MKAFNERIKIKFLVYLIASILMLTEVLDRAISKEMFESQTTSYVPTRSNDNNEDRIIN